MLSTLALLLTAATAAADPQVVPLWPDGAPGFEARRGEAEQAKDYWVKNIHNPSITVYPAPRDKANGAAIERSPNTPRPAGSWFGSREAIHSSSAGGRRKRPISESGESRLKSCPG